MGSLVAFNLNNFKNFVCIYLCVVFDSYKQLRKTKLQPPPLLLFSSIVFVFIFSPLVCTLLCAPCA